MKKRTPKNVRPGRVPGAVLATSNRNPAPPKLVAQIEKPIYGGAFLARAWAQSTVCAADFAKRTGARANR